MSRNSPSKPFSKAPSRARMVLPALAAGVLVACGALLIRGRSHSVTVSQVLRDISELALHKADSRDPDDGGLIGKWRLVASSADHFSGTLYDLRLTTDDMVIAAKQAVVIVDPATDCISFEMDGVVMAILEDPVKSSHEHFLNELEHHVLGPIPYRYDIVADASSIMGGRGASSEPSAVVSAD